MAMTLALINANILTPEGFKPGHSLLMETGRIVGLCPDADLPTDVDVVRDAGGMRLIPGLIDLQVNGGGGVLFNDDPSVETIRRIGAAHRQFGTTGFLPTLISDDRAVMAAAIQAVDAAIAEGVPGVLGLHLEGPHLNVDRKGVHDATKFGAVDQSGVDFLASLTRGKTLVTLAPEMTTPETIAALTARGVVVAAGHTQATYAQTHAAMEAGLTGFTHLFNAMRPMESRRPGIIAAALEDPRAWCGIIMDGHHVHPAMLRLALRAKVGDQVFLVTDAMPSVGASHSSFTLGDLEVTVADGQCVTADGTLAGSDLDMIRAVRNAHDKLGVSVPQAVRMASEIPAQFMGLGRDYGTIRVGQAADLVLIDDDFAVLDSWIGGQSGSAS